MNEIELLAPAGSREAAVAAVQNGAGAIYLGFGDFNARRGAENFTQEQMAETIGYCRARGVKTHITLNTLLRDREFSALEKTIDALNALAPDAVIVADLGVARALRELAPELCLHASTQLTIHNIAGAQAAAALGFSRVVLSRELSEQAIAEITRSVPIETEVFVHGALCMCYSGQCYMSAMIGRRSGNRGLCAQPCRLPYRLGERGRDGYPLSLRDLCLAGELPRLRALGVSSLKIEGRMKRPEYVAVVCGIYSRLLREERAPTEEELLTLRRIFSRGGFTDGYFRGRKGPAMFGTRAGAPPAEDTLYQAARVSYAGEHVQIPVTFSLHAAQNKPLTLQVSDPDGHSYTATGAIVETARTRAADEASIREKLLKTGGTPFTCTRAKIALEPGCMIPASALGAVRRECLQALLAARSAPPVLSRGVLSPLPDAPECTAPGALSVTLRKKEQLSDALLSLPLARVYLPPEELIHLPAQAKLPLGVQLPQIIWDEEWPALKPILTRLFARGVTHALVSNLGQIAPLQALGFMVEGDIGLNLFNSRALAVAKDLGLSGATLSPELKLSQVRDIKKCIPCELVVYGRLPLMICENCAVAPGGRCPGAGEHVLIDRRGKRFPVFCMPHHRNLICNADVLYLADQPEALSGLGLSRLRLLFTDESPAEVCRVVRAHLAPGAAAPRDFTRGLYYRGVE